MARTHRDEISKTVKRLINRRIDNKWFVRQSRPPPSHTGDYGAEEVGSQEMISPRLPRESPLNVAATQFVWFYVTGPDNGKELNLSIRSVQKNFLGIPQITVIGTKPSWYDGHYIPMKQYSGIKDVKGNMPFRDTQHKLVSCVADECAEIDEEFVWIMDDTYMMKPTTIEEMRVQRYDPWYKPLNRSTWHRLIGETFSILRKNGFSTLQYGTHLPHVFTKTNLRDMFERYNYPGNLYLFEVLYGNTFGKPDESLPYAGFWEGVEYPAFLSRHLRPVKLAQLDSLNANFVNHSAVCWNTVLKRWIEQKLAE